MNLSKLGFVKTSVSFGATRKLLRHLKDNNIEVYRNVTTGLRDSIEQFKSGRHSRAFGLKSGEPGGTISVAKGDMGGFGIFQNKLIKKYKKELNSPRNTLFHESGHLLHPLGMNDAAGALRPERAANVEAINLIKKFESPKQVDKSIQGFKQKTRLGYKTYQRSAVEYLRDRGPIKNIIYGKRPIKDVYKKYPVLRNKAWEL